ncbi:hypothetical protein Hanom_Chr06g00556311 [Helianthus anomalus]
MSIRLLMGVQFLTANSSALDAPPGYITLFAAFFRDGNFWLPVSRFLGEVLTRYGIHISQVNALGLHRSQCSRRSTCFTTSPTEGFYSFNSHTVGVLPCTRDPPKSFHDWKPKFFYIQRGVILIDIHYRSESEGVPKVAVSVSFTDQEWYKTLTWRPTPIIQLEEKAHIAAGMSLLLMNVFDPKVAGEMAMEVLPVGEPKWTERIRDIFLHPYSESIDAYGTVVLGAPEARTDLDKAPTREETILLSSEECTGSSHDLIHRASCAGPHQRPSQDSTAGDASTLPVVDPAAIAAGLERKEARRKKAEEGETEKRKSAEESAGAPTRKCSSRVKLLDYGFFSDSLSGLDAWVKRPAPDADDKETLTKMTPKKQKIFADKKWELDE